MSYCAPAARPTPPACKPRNAAPWRARLSRTLSDLRPILFQSAGLFHSLNRRTTICCVPARLLHASSGSPDEAGNRGCPQSTEFPSIPRRAAGEVCHVAATPVNWPGSALHFEAQDPSVNGSRRAESAKVTKWSNCCGLIQNRSFPHRSQDRYVLASIFWIGRSPPVANTRPRSSRPRNREQLPLRHLDRKHETNEQWCI